MGVPTFLLLEAEQAEEESEAGGGRFVLEILKAGEGGSEQVGWAQRGREGACEELDKDQSQIPTMHEEIFAYTIYPDGSEYPECVMHTPCVKYSGTPRSGNMLCDSLAVGPANKQQKIT